MLPTPPPPLQADLVSNPLWVIRTRMQTGIFVNQIGDAPASLVQTAAEIARTEGFRAFYKGFSAQLLGLSHVAGDHRPSRT